MSCKCAKATDEYHGWECEVSGGACMFLIPDSKACAKEYGEGPDMIPDESEDDMTKYDCLDCGKQFVLGDRAVANCPTGFPICPYCGQNNIDGTVMAKAGEIDEMGCMAIWTMDRPRAIGKPDEKKPG